MKGDELRQKLENESYKNNGIISNGMEPEKKPNGALLGSIIIIVILIVGGIFVWQAKVKQTLEEKEAQSAQTATLKDDTDTEELNTLKESLNPTDTEIDAGVIEGVE